MLLFVRSFEKEGSIAQTWVQTPSSLEITLKDAKTLEHYQAGLDIKVIYEYEGTHEIILPIRDSLVDKERKRIDLEFTDNSFPVAGEDIAIKEIYYPVGYFYLYDVKTKKAEKIEGDPFAVHTSMRSVLYRNRLLLTNGIDAVMMWDGEALTALKELPRFKRLFSHKNRLWGTTSHPSEGMYVYFMRAPDAFPEAIDAWGVEEKTKKPPFIDLSVKGRADDEVLGVEELGDKIIFFCRHHLQIWKGLNPLEPKDFIFERRINESLLQEDLMLSHGNEILFVSPTGLKSLSSLNVGQQIAVSDIGKARSFVQRSVKDLTPFRLNGCSSFAYDKGGFVGFKVGDKECLILMPHGEEKLLTLFSGPFRHASCIITQGGRLYLALCNELLTYEDGATRVPMFFDQFDNHAHPISIKWVTPLISCKGKRYQGKRYQINCTLPSSFF